MTTPSMEQNVAELRGGILTSYREHVEHCKAKGMDYYATVDHMAVDHWPETPAMAGAVNAGLAVLICDLVYERK